MSVVAKSHCHLCHPLCQI